MGLDLVISGWSREANCIPNIMACFSLRPVADCIQDQDAFS